MFIARFSLLSDVSARILGFILRISITNRKKHSMQNMSLIKNPLLLHSIAQLSFSDPLSFQAFIACLTLPI